MGLLSTPPADLSDFDTDTGADRLNIYEMVALVTGGSVAINGVALLAAVAPAFTTAFSATALATAYVGYCKRNDLDLNPTTWDMWTKTDEGKKLTSPVAAPQPVTTPRVTRWQSRSVTTIPPIWGFFS